MFFFIGGVQPKTVSLDTRPRMCPACGLQQGRLRRTDHHLSIFFLPVIRIRKGEPFFQCDHCGHRAREANRVSAAPDMETTDACSACGGVLEPGFRYCPYCGKRK